MAEQNDRTTSGATKGSERVTMKRRGLIAGAAALATGLIAKRAEQPVGAATGSYANIGFYALPGTSFPFSSNFPSNSVFGLAGSTNVDFGGSVTSNFTAGVYGFDASNSGSGVYGLCTGVPGVGVTGNAPGVGGVGVDGGGGSFGAGGIGVYGNIPSGATSTNSFGVLGQNLSTGTGSVGVQGEAHGISGIGVVGLGTGFIGVQGTGSAAGVFGMANFDPGSGVVGLTNGLTSNGVVTGGTVGVSNQTSLPGVYGNHTTTGIGVKGSSTSGTGVSGLIPGGSASGTLAISGTNNASAANSHGIVGTAGSGHGLIGNTNFTGGGPPYYAGLVGNAPNGAYAGLFFGKVSITGTLNGHTAIMEQAQVAVAHPDGSHRLSYALSSTESLLEEFGKGTLTHGQATVQIDPTFAVLADMSDYHVFLTAYGDYHLHVAEMKADGFVARVTSVGGGTAPTGGSPVGVSQVAKASGATGTFSWKVVAKRKDVQAARLATYTFPKIVPPDLSHLPKPS